MSGTLTETLSAPPLQDLSWKAQSGKEELLSAVMEACLREHFKETGAHFLKQTDHVARLSHDWVIVLKDGTRLTVEGKFEDYAESLFPEFVQIVNNGKGPRRIEPGWVYKTTADFLLYVSPVSGVATLIARKRTLQQQILLACDVLTKTADFEIPCLLNAALNQDGSNSKKMSRAGIGLGLLRTNILQAYILTYGTEGLYQFDLAKELNSLKTYLTTSTEVSSSVAKWAKEKLMSEPASHMEHQIEVATLPALLESSPLVVSGELHAPAVAARGYSFFRNAVSARIASGQSWLFQDVPGKYISDDNKTFELTTPFSSRVKATRDGKAVTRNTLQYRSPTQLKEICDPSAPPVAAARSLSKAYLQNIYALPGRVTAPAVC